jgi:uncharacterized protein (TIGR02271 family)
MGFFNDIFGNADETRNETRNETTDENAKLVLRKEELEIDKNLVKTGEVELSKEIIEEQKSVDVPLTREEVVIERRSLNNERSDSPITSEEAIRIPVSEENVDVEKYTVITGEVSAYKRNIEDTKHIDETLKREEVRVNKIGDPDIAEESNQQYH